MSVIKGTKDAKTMEVVKGTKDSFNFRGSDEVRKLRCKKCGELALPAPDGKGGMQMQCFNCGTIFKSTALD
jgi:uncharacterized OB-fold protein